MSVVIKIEDLWKEYRLGVIGHGTLTQDLQSWWAKLRGKEDPNSRLAPVLAGQEQRIEGDHFWALRGINLEVKEGEILGIIGKNGAGKSTLLKILSRVTAPTKGTIKVKGRIASLLEVGTGFHPELTGRENIFLNGAILGMSKQEIKAKLDEIIDFSGVEKFVDTPVKRYSSGMYVRLAFAVAAHLDPEILIIDEVLAVGDAEFQKKCLGKMRSVAQQGRTVLFVSHNMVAVKSLCKSAVLIQDGKNVQADEVGKVVNTYLSYSEESVVAREWSDTDDTAPKGNYYKLKKIFVKPSGSVDNCLEIPVEYPIELGIDVLQFGDAGELDFTFHVKSENNIVFTTGTLHCDDLISRNFVQGRCKYRCTIPANYLNSRPYSVDLLIVRNQNKVICKLDDILSFEPVESKKRNVAYMGKRPGLVGPYLPWSVLGEL